MSNRTDLTRLPNRSELIPDGPRVDELFGMGEARIWAEELEQDLADYLAGNITWSEMNPGALLRGPPGTGKTIFAKAVAASCRLPLIVTSYAQWQRSKSGHMGDVLAAMHETFEIARCLAPCIVFIDEIEAVSSRQTSGQNLSWYTGIITALNEELHGSRPREGIIVIAASNYPDRIDAALLRPGRLDREIEISPADQESLKGIIRFHLRADLPNADLGDLSVATIGMTGADIEQLVRRARRRARRFKRALLTGDLLAVLGEKVDDLPHDLLECIAVHEAGHATAAIAFEVSRNVSVSLFHLGKGAAATFFDPQLKAVTRKVVEDRIAVALAGRAAEDVLLGEVTAGAGGSDDCDLAVATHMAISAVAQWGLSSSKRPIWEQIVAADHALKKEARQMLDAAYARGLDLMRERKLQVRAVVAALLGRRALAHDDIAALLARSGAGVKKAAAPRRPRKRA